MPSHSYEDCDQAIREQERADAKVRLRQLLLQRFELATELGQLSSSLLFDRNAGDLSATHSLRAREMAELAKLTDKIREAENELA